MDKKEFCEKAGIDEQTFGKILELDFKDLAGLVSDYCVSSYSGDDTVKIKALLALILMESTNKQLQEILSSDEIQNFRQMLRPVVAPLLQHKKPKKKNPSTTPAELQKRLKIIEAAAVRLGMKGPEISSQVAVAKEIKNLEEKYKFQDRAYKKWKRKISPTAMQIQQFESMVVQVDWEILPPGEEAVQKLVGYYKRIIRARPYERIDWDRLHYVRELGPDVFASGRNAFDGYIIGVFNDQGKAVFECPMYGNAIYVVRGDWISLSKLTKSEIINLPGVRRIIHSEHWKTELSAALEIRSKD